MSNMTQYVRKCKDCQGEILMKNHSGKWAALEKDGSTQHRCKIPDMTNISRVESLPTPPQETPQKTEIVADHTRKKEDEMITTLTQRITTMEAEITKLKSKATTLENWVKKVSESAVMNQL